MRAHGSDSLASNPDPVAEQAAQWIVRLTADDEAECERARAGFDAWTQADPHHAAAAARLQGFIGRVQAVSASTGSTKPARAALNAAFAQDRKPKRTQRIGVLLTLALALGVPAWLTLHSYPPAYLMADMRTATGQWAAQTLTDGTHITLGSASAANLHFDEKRRALELVTGEILLEVAHDAARPFIVETTHGSIRALGTRFVVARRDDVTVLTMLESRASVQAAKHHTASHASSTSHGNDHANVFSAGQRVRITPDRLGPVEDIDVRSVSDAWKHHQLVVQDRPLPDVLDELNRHRPGHIQYDRSQLEGIQVSAVLPLNDTDRALQLLVTSFPAIRVRLLTPYLVRVDAPRHQQD